MKTAWLASLLLIPGAVFAGFEEGVDAFNKGNYHQAAREWQPLAARGDADAARNLAGLYHQGLGVKTDHIIARRWYKLAASKCNATAQNNLGLLLLNGQGGEKDLVAAFRLFEASAQQGLHADADGMWNLVGMYANGLGTQQNIVEAYKWAVLYLQFTTNQTGKKEAAAWMPHLEGVITASQKTEAVRRAKVFERKRCVPKE